ncbi:helix-turn-helix domain-containing protein [Acinetobacter haemolyticus]
MNIATNTQAAIDVLYKELDQLENQIISECHLTNEESEQLELLVTKAIKYGELVAKRDSKGMNIVLRESNIDEAIISGSDAVKGVLEHVEFVFISKSLEYTRGNVTKAAEILGWNRGTFNKRRMRGSKE